MWHRGRARVLWDQLNLIFPFTTIQTSDFGQDLEKVLQDNCRYLFTFPKLIDLNSFYSVWELFTNVCQLNVCNTHILHIYCVVRFEAMFKNIDFNVFDNVLKNRALCSRWIFCFPMECWSQNCENILINIPLLNLRPSGSFTRVCICNTNVPVTRCFQLLPVMEVYLCLQLLSSGLQCTDGGVLMLSRT